MQIEVWFLVAFGARHEAFSDFTYILALIEYNKTLDYEDYVFITPFFGADK